MAGTSNDKPTGPVTVSWAFVVGVNEFGHVHMIDHDYTHEIKAKRIATLDDIYSACYVASSYGDLVFARPSTDVYSFAFVVFQMPQGFIAASPDVFEELVPVAAPGIDQVRGALGVLQGQIIAQKAADMATPMAVQATLSVLNAGAKAVNKAEGKSEGGLYVA